MVPRPLVPLVAAALLTGASCILDPVDGPDYPAEWAASFQLDTLGVPVACAFSSDGGVAAVAAGGSVVVIDPGSEDSWLLFTVEDSLVDVDFLPDGSELVAVSQDSLYHAPPGFPGQPGRLGLPAGAAVVAPLAGKAVCVIFEDGSLSVLEGSGWTVPPVVSTPADTALSACATRSGTAVLIGDGDSLRVVDPATGSARASAALAGECRDVFTGGAGRACAVCAGSNEVWVLDDSDLEVELLVTFPSEPVSGAVTPDGGWYYAACPGYGLLISSSAGSLELSTEGYGVPCDIAVSPEGSAAILLDSLSGTAFLLVR
ncbi:hypothetical protein GX411_08220 [Candidatus Fermentibacteria bacterium]|nr:hypothetical protein [Candidatus Fermentibacteria bacterium]